MSRLPTGALVDALAVHFRPRSREGMREAVRQLAREGYGDHQIAEISALSVEQVRKLLAEHVMTGNHDDGLGAVPGTPPRSPQDV